MIVAPIIKYVGMIDPNGRYAIEPHFGHLYAVSETFDPHSLQFINAIVILYIILVNIKLKVYNYYPFKVKTFFRITQDIDLSFLRYLLLCFNFLRNFGGIVLPYLDDCIQLVLYKNSILFLPNLTSPLTYGLNHLIVSYVVQSV